MGRLKEGEKIAAKLMHCGGPQEGRLKYYNYEESNATTKPIGDKKATRDMIVYVCNKILLGKKGMDVCLLCNAKNTIKRQSIKEHFR